MYKAGDKVWIQDRTFGLPLCLKVDIIDEEDGIFTLYNPNAYEDLTWTMVEKDLIKQTFPSIPIIDRRIEHLS